MTYQKEGESVKRQTERVEDSAVKPDLRIFHSVQDVGPREPFVLRRIAIFLEAGVDGSPFILGDEVRFRRPISNIPVSKQSQNASRNSFNDKDPALNADRLARVSHSRKNANSPILCSHQPHS